MLAQRAIIASVGIALRPGWSQRLLWKAAVVDTKGKIRRRTGKDEEKNEAATFSLSAWPGRLSFGGGRDCIPNTLPLGISLPP